MSRPSVLGLTSVTVGELDARVLYSVEHSGQ